MNNDLISREALKKCAIPCEIHNGALTDLCVPLYQIDNAPTVEPFERIGLICEENCGYRPQGKWYEHIDKGLLKARHGNYVVYDVDYLLDNLAREVNLMESVRRQKGGAENG